MPSRWPRRSRARRATGSTRAPSPSRRRRRRIPSRTETTRRRRLRSADAAAPRTSRAAALRDGQSPRLRLRRDLGVVLLRVDILAGTVLHAMQLAALLGRDRAVGLVLRFDGGHARLLLVEAIGLAGGELARRDAGVDALLLIGLALIDAGRHRRGGLREGAEGSDGQREAGGECRELVHGDVLWVVVESKSGLRVPPVYNEARESPPTRRP